MPRRKTEGASDPLYGDSREQVLRRQEITAIVWRMMLDGLTVKEMEAAFKEPQYARYEPYFRHSDAWNLVRRAGKDKRLRFVPSTENELAGWLERKYSWQKDRITVVVSPIARDVAQQAAFQLLDLIHTYKSFGVDPVHIGFAGGRTLRAVAEVLARLLRSPSDAHPNKIVFHAMVAAFGDEHFESDPNNFITYFIRKPVAPKVFFNRLPAPGIVEVQLKQQLQQFKAIRDVQDQARHMNIIVTSGGSWSDPHSPLPENLRKVQPADVAKLEARNTVGDLLWQPVSRNGPVDMAEAGLEFRPNTLVDLHELPGMIAKNVRVMLVMGTCSDCLDPHGELLDVLLGNGTKLVTDVVTDSVTVHDLVAKTSHG